MPVLKKDIILGIDTSCDDTSCGIVKKGKMVLSSVVSSQDSIHAPFGGIVPEIASRAHVEKIAWVVKEAMEKANITFENIGGIGVTQGPGLPGSLLVGWEFSKALSFALDIPFIGINHLEAHLFSPFLDRKEEIYFPVLGLVVSGGHTLLAYAEKPFHFSLLGQTRDDACGEALDKVARILGLPYPGGPYLEKLAEKGSPNRIKFPTAILPNTYDFSFSGIKTHAWRVFKENKYSKEDIAASFQEAVINILWFKLRYAVNSLSVKSIVVGGGVVANRRLRNMLSHLQEEVNLPVYLPSFPYAVDNGAMIAGLAYYLLKEGKFSKKDEDVKPGLILTQL